MAQDGFLRPVTRFVRLRSRIVTLIGIQEKMEYLGEKMKTHVLKFSQGSWARNQPYREVEESQGFPEVKQSKYKHGFFTMYSLDQ